MLSRLKNLTETGDATDSKPGSHGQEESLATVLPTREDRTNLLLLVADLMEGMRAQILDAFDPNEEKKDVPADEDVAAPEASSTDAETERKREEKQRKALENRTKDLSKPENMELKDAALGHFDSWRDKVMQRVGEAVNQRGEEDRGGAAKPEQKSRPTSREQPVAEKSDGKVHLQQIFPPLETPLGALSEARRILIMHSILLLLLGLESYPAESRVLMLRLTSSLGLSVDMLAQDEMSTAKGLLEVAKQQMNADEETKNKAAENSTARKWKVGLGAVAGAVLIGVTGGLAAPLLAAGVGSMMGGLGLGATATAGYLGALAGSAPLVGVLFGAYGGRMTGRMVDEYAKEVEDFAFLPINKPSLFQRGKQHEDRNARHLRVAVGISGWLAEEDEAVLPWQVLSGHSTEAFALRWELKALLRLGHAINTYIKSYAWSFAKKEILSRTIFASLASALVLPYGLAKASRIIDNPFSVAMSRSEKAGVVLADALINKVQGERPVTLMGYSLGARVIYSCLTELANRRTFGLVESVCLIGGPVPSDPLLWRRIRSVVAGRVINVYSSKDYLLAFLYRANSLQYGIAGLQAIPDVGGIENVDVSDLVLGHTQYRFLVGSILQELNLEDIDAAAVEQQLKKLKRQEKEEEAAREKSKGESRSAEDEADEMERDVQQRTDGIHDEKQLRNDAEQ
ncbi:DUF726-domain-containing protein [Cryphonectria parasitica EP155]|uniref:DUF726-domain-containing protein n=1 Tax=Cryphonectria parasitica (strain ATCC 38755 / EP155) TaxID=660469 RepID=A0A9P4Y5G6_CRYP1|nr:DUF726-domain-containing protein [Cryphonectria parasitica EP155]KAF3767319.1 DUF726-domain-containing protein [Cryphonectria parasitica EP155]